MGDVNLEIKLNNLDDRVIKIEESGGGGSGGDGYITSVSNDFNVVNKKLSLSTDVTTKLSKVDNKIDKPASATDGQVLTYNGTSNEWEAKNPSASITEPTDLEKGIIGGDEWVSGGSYTIGESVVIDENKLYLLVGDGGSTTKPSTDTAHSIWKETSISKLNSSLEEKGNCEVIAEMVSKTNQSFNGIDLSKYSLIGLAMTYDKGIMICSTFPAKFLFERPSTNGYYAVDGKNYAGIKQISGNLTNASFNLLLNRNDGTYSNYGTLLFGVK